jgi:hypothetical protein
MTNQHMRSSVSLFTRRMQIRSINNPALPLGWQQEKGKIGEYLPSKHKDLSSSPNTIQKQNKQNQKRTSVGEAGETGRAVYNLWECKMV